MTHRRSFLTSLLALPLLRRWAPQPPATTSTDMVIGQGVSDVIYYEQYFSPEDWNQWFLFCEETRQQFALKSSTGAPILVSQPDKIQPGVWYHVAWSNEGVTP